MDGTLDEVSGWVRTARRIVALTGAGISTDSGIPDFRGPQGVWTKNPGAEKLSNIHSYMSAPEVRKASRQSRLAHPAFHAKPNAAERAQPRAPPHPALDVGAADELQHLVVARRLEPLAPLGVVEADVDAARAQVAAQREARVAAEELDGALAGEGEAYLQGLTGPGMQSPLHILIWMLAILAGFGLAAGAIFIMPAVTAFVASFFSDEIAAEVERSHYPADPPGLAISTTRAGCWAGSRSTARTRCAEP